jgi:hypothetical protein
MQPEKLDDTIYNDAEPVELFVLMELIKRGNKSEF